MESTLKKVPPSSSDRSMMMMMMRVDDEKTNEQDTRDNENVLEPDLSMSVSNSEAILNESSRAVLKVREMKLKTVFIDKDTGERRNLRVNVDYYYVKKMHDHQKQGLRYAWRKVFFEFPVTSPRGYMIADPMGTGKTLQMIALLHVAFTNGFIKRAMIACPSGLVSKWVEELHDNMPGQAGEEKIRIINFSKMHKIDDKLDATRLIHKKGGIIVIAHQTFRIIMDSNKPKKSKNKDDDEDNEDNDYEDEDEDDEDEDEDDENIDKENHDVEEAASPGAMEKYQEIRKVFTKFGFDVFISDEIHVIRNEHTAIAKAHCVVEALIKIWMSGTIIQNNLRELFAVCRGLKPDLFPNSKTFRTDVIIPFKKGFSPAATGADKEEMNKAAEHLKSILGQFVKRVINVNENLKLPIKTEYAIEIKLTAEQVQVYEWYLEQFGSKTVPNNDKLFFTKVFILRLICNYPLEDDIMKTMANFGSSVSMKKILRKLKRSSARSPAKVDLERSYKLLILCDLIELVVTAGDKIVVFACHRDALDLIQRAVGEHLIARGLKQSWKKDVDYFRLDGSTSLENRKNSIAKFNNLQETDAQVFLVSTKAGGQGINLTGANRVAMFETSFNPFYDAQAVCRAHRIGQTKPVFVYQFKTSGTVEARITESSFKKIVLASMIADSGDFSNHVVPIEGNSFFTLDKQRKEVPFCFVKEDDKIVRDICAKHANIILSCERSARTMIDVLSLDDDDVESALFVVSNDTLAQTIWRLYCGAENQGTMATEFGTTIYKWVGDLADQRLSVTLLAVSKTFYSCRFSGDINSLDKLDSYERTPLNESELLIAYLSEQAKLSQYLFIGTDRDIDGERAGIDLFKLCLTINPEIKVYRLAFSSVTKSAIECALFHPLELTTVWYEASSMSVKLDAYLDCIYKRIFEPLMKAVDRSDLCSSPLQLPPKEICQFGAWEYMLCMQATYCSQEYMTSAYASERHLYIVHRQGNSIVEFESQGKYIGKDLITKGKHLRKVLKEATVTNEHVEEQIKESPLPLNLSLLVHLASKYLGLSAEETFDLAANLYSKGLISYPFTNNNVYPEAMNLQRFIAAHTDDESPWREYALRTQADCKSPREGDYHNDVYPPIHPTRFALPESGKEGQLYEFIVRHFIATFAGDTVCDLYTTTIAIQGEVFYGRRHLNVRSKGYYDVYDIRESDAANSFKKSSKIEFSPVEVKIADDAEWLTVAGAIDYLYRHDFIYGREHAKGSKIAACISKFLKWQCLIERSSDGYLLPKPAMAAFARAHSRVLKSEKSVEDLTRQMQEALQSLSMKKNSVDDDAFKATLLVVKEFAASWERHEEEISKQMQTRIPKMKEAYDFTMKHLVAKWSTVQ